MTSLDEDLSDFGPLCSSWIDSGRVVSAGVEEDDGLQWGGTEEGEVGVESESDRFRVVVGIFDGRAADVGEDCFVVGYDVVSLATYSTGGYRGHRISIGRVGARESDNVPQVGSEM